MRVTRISGLDFAELTIGHSRLLADDVSKVVDHFTGKGKMQEDEFEAAGFRIIAAGASIAGEEATGHKPARTIDALGVISENLKWNLTQGDFIAALIFILDLRPAAAGAETGEKKQTG